MQKIAEKEEKINEESKNSNIKNNKTKEIVSKVINSIWFVIIIGILIFIKTMFFYENTISNSGKIEFQTILGTIDFTVILVCLLSMLPNRARIITTLISNFIVSLVLLGDNIYYIYSNSFLSIAQITNLQYGEEILSTLPAVFKINQLLYFADIILIIALCKWMKIKFQKKENKTKKKILAKAISGVVGIVVFCIVGVKYVEKGKEKSYNKDMQIRESTIWGYHIYDIENLLTQKKNTKYKSYEKMKKDYEELKEEYNNRYGKEKYDFKGISKNSNVIVLQLESIQEFVINKTINGEQITPNLNKFLSENIEISNMNMQSYSTTADSEHSSITSIYPMENGMSYSKFYTNTYDNIFEMFNNADYTTSYMHGNEAKFWNRGNVYSKFGVQNIELKDKFDDTEYINGFMSDEVLYKQGVEKIKNYQNPFMSFIVSASSHTPFELEGLQDRSKVRIDVGKYKGTYFGNYLEAVNYADYAFGVFLEGLKQEGLYDDTTILVFGDHNGINMYNEEMLEFLKQYNPYLTDVDIKLNYTKVACGLKIPGVSHMKIEKPVSKLDIKPTLAYLCDLEDKFSLGTNIFASKEFVSLNNERIITNKYYYDENWYDIKTGNQLDMKSLDEDIKELLERYYNYMKKELEISNSVTINNLLAQN